MNPNLTSLRSVGVLLSFALISKADILILRNHQEIHGELHHASAREIFFTVGDVVTPYSITDVESIRFEYSSSDQTPQSDARSIPAGTQIRVRTVQQIISKKGASGTLYGGISEDPIMVGYATRTALEPLIPAGSRVKLKLTSGANHEWSLALDSIEYEKEPLYVSTHISSQTLSQQSTKKSNAPDIAREAGAAGSSVGGTAGTVVYEGTSVAAATAGTIAMLGGTRVDVAAGTEFVFYLTTSVPIPPKRRPAVNEHY